jgi:hypothetical protein
MFAADAGEVGEIADMWSGMVDQYASEMAERLRHRNIPPSWYKSQWYVRGGNSPLQVLRLIKSEPNA